MSRRRSILPTTCVALLCATALAQSPREPGAPPTTTPARPDPGSPEALALLDAAARSIGAPDRLARLSSYRVVVRASKRHRALESGQPIELPLEATVVWRRDAGHVWRVEETVVGEDGDDEIVVDSCGRTAAFSWARLPESSPPRYVRMPATSGVPGPRDPLHLLLVDLPQRRDRLSGAALRADEEIDGVGCDVVSANLSAGLQRPSVVTLWIPRDGGPPRAIRLGDGTEKVRLDDWREIDGIRIPHAIRSEPLLAGARTSGEVVACELDPAEPPVIDAPDELADPADVVPASKRPSTSDT